MNCFLCPNNVFTGTGCCKECDTLVPVVSRMERVRITRDAEAAISTLKHEYIVPFWISEKDLQKKSVSTVIEVEAHGIKVLLVVYGHGEVLASATPEHTPLSGVVAKQLLKGS
jgi:hypothetical protein